MHFVLDKEYKRSESNIEISVFKMNCLKDNLESWREANKMVHWNEEDLKHWIQELVKSKDLRPELLPYLEDEIDFDREYFYARVKGKLLNIQCCFANTFCPPVFKLMNII